MKKVFCLFTCILIIITMSSCKDSTAVPHESVTGSLPTNSEEIKTPSQDKVDDTKNESGNESQTPESKPESNLNCY